MRRFVVGLALGLPAVPVAAQQGSAPAPVPEAKAVPVETKSSAGSRDGRDAALRWFPEVGRTVNAPPGGGDIVGTFAFANPGAVAFEWREFATSCACAKCTIRVSDRTYELKPKPRDLVQLVEKDGTVERVPVAVILVGPGEQGEVQVHVQLNGADLKKSVSVDVHTTDPETPMARLQLDVVMAEAIRVTPSVVDLQSVRPGSQTAFSITVASPLQPEFEILSVELPADVTATWSRSPAADAGWQIHGVFTAKAQNESADGAITVHTDIAAAKAVKVRLHAKVEMPVVVTPGFVSLGSIHLNTKATAAIRFEPRDGSDLQATQIRLEKLSVAAGLVTVRSRKDGKALVVELEVASSTPRGLVRGDIVVALDHPGFPEQRIMFNGFVR